MKKTIIANWKMNPRTVAEAKKLAAEYKKIIRRSNKVNIIAAPPFVYMRFLDDRMGQAAQNSFYRDHGAYTGEISPAMLKSSGIKYVILGHSERREYINETDEIVNSKIKEVLRAGLTAVLCVGEKNREDENFQIFVRDEIRKDLAGVSRKYSSRVIIAYEPIWAIGSGIAVKPEDLFEMATYIRRTLLDLFGKSAAHKITVLYGGSVDSKNAKAFIGVKGVDGLLVGGASLNTEEFKKIALAAL